MDGLRALAGWVLPALAVGLMLGIPWVLGWIALALS